MLGKLLKYEFKSTARTFIPLYIIAILFSIICRIFNEFAKSLEILQTPAGLLIVLYIILMIAIVVITFVVILQQFYKNLMGDEGYLMFTLPVEPHKHILTKLISAIVWTLASFIVALLTISILVYSPDVWDLIQEVLFMVAFDIWMPIRCGLIIIAFQGIASIMMIYTSISIGQLVTGHKVVGSLVSYFGLYIINQIIMTIIMVIIGYFYQDFIYELSYDAMEIFEVNFLPTLTIVLSIVNAGLSAAYFFVINYIFKNKLNLE